jgi:SAM-dependent methyltransferase
MVLIVDFPLIDIISNSLWKKNADVIRGRCLEIVDPMYTKKYGGDKVEMSEVLDIIPRPTTTIHGDLRNVPQIPSNTYDCLIITQTFNVIDDYDSAIRESYRILKPGGVLLATMPTLSPAWNLKINMWRMTVDSARYVFSKIFPASQVTVQALGNKEVALAFWQGFALEDVSPEVIPHTDESFPLIIGIKAIK